MSIIYNEEKCTFKLDTTTSSYILQVYEENYLLNLYYGPWIPDAYISGRQLRRCSGSFSPANPKVEVRGFSPDTAPMEYGCNGAGDFRISALAVHNVNGDA